MLPSTSAATKHVPAVPLGGKAKLLDNRKRRAPSRGAALPWRAPSRGRACGERPPVASALPWSRSPPPGLTTRQAHTWLTIRSSASSTSTCARRAPSRSPAPSCTASCCWCGAARSCSADPGRAPPALPPPPPPTEAAPARPVLGPSTTGPGPPPRLAVVVAPGPPLGRCPPPPLAPPVAVAGSAGAPTGPGLATCARHRSNRARPSSEFWVYATRHAAAKRPQPRGGGGGSP